MKLMRMLIPSLFLLVLALPAMAQCPDEVGIFMTGNGTLLGGRVSEAWCGANGEPIMPGRPGNTENAMSWDGTALGTQWRVWDMAIDENGAGEIGNTLDGNGNGTITYSTNYLGGQFWLSKDHTWSYGIVDLMGDITSYLVITTVTYVAGNAVGATSNVSFTGVFSDCPQANGCVIEFAIANAILVWSSAYGTPLPADYPDFLCGADMGELFDACCITASLDCLVSAEESTWGAVKSLYR
jgi:hypothetical protein